MPESEIDVQAGAEAAARKALEAEGSAPEGDPKTFSAEYVRDLRQEAARHRVEAQQWRQPWEGVTEDDQQVWRDLIRHVSTDPKAGAQEMKAIAEFLLREEGPPPKEDPKPMSAQDIDRLIDQRVQATQQQTIIREIESEAEKLGYKPGSLDYVNLLWVAEHETNTDLKAAHEKLQERRGGWVEQEISRRREGAGWPHVTRGGGAPAPNTKSPKTFEEAKAAMMARFDAI